MKSKWLTQLKKIGLLRTVLLGAAILVLIICSLPWDVMKSSEASSAAELPTAADSSDFSYEKQLEERLEYILEQMDGITSVDVMITLSSTSEKVLEKTQQLQEENQEEEKGTGDSAEKSISSSTSKSSEALLINPGDGSSVPYVLKEISPTIQGVLIAAEGTVTQTKISEISEAVQALFGIEAHKVKVIEKKSQAEEAN